VSDRSPGRGLWWRFRSFLVVGAVATLVQYVLLVALVELRDWPATPASSAGFAVSALLNYLLNYHVTFASRAPHRQAALRFALVALSGLALNALCMWMLERNAGLHYLLAQVGATLATLAWTFAASQGWAFRAPSRGESGI
jgi:putative flippase GtrA